MFLFKVKGLMKSFQFEVNTTLVTALASVGITFATLLTPSDKANEVTKSSSMNVATAFAGASAGAAVKKKPSKNEIE